MDAVQRGLQQWENKAVNICNKLPQYGVLLISRSCKVHKHIAVNMDIIFTIKLIKKNRIYACKYYQYEAHPMSISYEYHKHITGRIYLIFTNMLIQMQI